MISDPIERIISDALKEADIQYVSENHPDAKSLDFYLTKYHVHIEVKQFHTPRTAKQIERSDDIILVVGRNAASTFAELIKKKIT
ncbi:MAG: hypothetical protein AAGA97_09470 [Pseudomonadota bacterium]